MYLHTISCSCIDFLTWYNLGSAFASCIHMAHSITIRVGIHCICKNVRLIVILQNFEFPRETYIATSCTFALPNWWLILYGQEMCDAVCSLSSD